jgi:hypothetical protein
MLKIGKQLRSNYSGEKIVTDRNHTNGIWQDTVEHVPNAVTNNQISNRAVVLGNGPSRLSFDLKFLDKFSGLLGADTVQTYGCNALYRDYTPDFLVAGGNPTLIKEIAESQYVLNNIVYVHAIDLLAYPNKFYLIPHDPYTDAGTTALYLAAFDGHKKIFMLGFDGQDTPGYNYNVYADTNGYDSKRSLVLEDKWTNDKKAIFDTYNDVEFILVTEFGESRFPDAWNYSTNFRHISHTQFTNEADL